MDRKALGYWEAIAGKWRIVPPLSPCDDDISYYETQAKGCADSRGRSTGLDALLLGVTPAIRSMRWPDGTRLISVDWSKNMFRFTSPQEPLRPRPSPVIGDWRELPLAAGSQDFAIGDGCYTALGSLEDAAIMNGEVCRILRPGGLFCLRCFCRAERPQPVRQLFEELLSGNVRNLDLFRWLLAMGVQGTSSQGVDLRSVWKVWKGRIPDCGALQAKFGWSQDAVANIERWSEANMRYRFSTLGELRELVAPWFDLLDISIPKYEWGERFPRLLMRARH